MAGKCDFLMAPWSFLRVFQDAVSVHVRARWLVMGDFNRVCDFSE